MLSSSTHLISSKSLHSFGSLHGNTCNSSDASSQTEPFAHFVRACGEYSSGCFEVHTASRIHEKYFLSLYDSLQRLMVTMVKYDGKCPICGIALLAGSFKVLQREDCATVSMNSSRWFSSPTVSGKFTANLRYCISDLLHYIRILHSFFTTVK